jgi:hypothetical protein
MKKLILSVLCVFAFFSCKKNNTDNTASGPTVPKVKNYSIGGDNVIYTYDVQGRIIKRANTASNWKYEYSYIANTATENYYVGTTLSTSKLFDLNADGLVTKETYALPAAAVPYKTTYSYNANKQVATIIKSNSLNTNTTIETHFYTGTILDSSQTTFSHNSDLYRFWYTYYTDKTNSIAYKNQGYLFWAETAAIPLKKQTSIFRTSGILNTQVDDYTYLFDAENRITKRTITIAGGGGTSVNDITYY